MSFAGIVLDGYPSFILRTCNFYFTVVWADPVITVLDEHTHKQAALLNLTIANSHDCVFQVLEIFLKNPLVPFSTSFSHVS